MHKTVALSLVDAAVFSSAGLRLTHDPSPSSVAEVVPVAPAPPPPSTAEPTTSAITPALPIFGGGGELLLSVAGGGLVTRAQNAGTKAAMDYENRYNNYIGVWGGRERYIICK